VGILILIGLCIVASFSIIGQGMGDEYRDFYSTRRAHNDKNAKVFLEALLSKDKETAQGYLGTDTKQAADRYCNGDIIQCAEPFIDPSWGQFETLELIESRNYSRLFCTHWTNLPTSCVWISLYIGDNSGKVIQWRGFIVSEDYTVEVRDLLDETHRTVLFPPPEFYED
jgi:hypothetical protein